MDSIEINYLLKKAQSSQTDIANELNVNPQTVNNVINNRIPSKRIATAVCSKINKPVDEVFPNIYSDEAA